MTLVLSNAQGPDEYLDCWAKEPPERELSIIGYLIGRYKDLSIFSLLIEDIAMGLSGTLRCTWGHAQDQRRVKLIDDDHSLLLQFLARPNCWNIQLDRMSDLLKSPESRVPVGSFKREFFMHAYSIGKKCGQIDDQNKSTIIRIALLLFSANMLYHVLCLNLYADICTINIVTTGTAKSSLSMNRSSKPAGDALKLSLLRHWTCTEDSQASVLHAVSILKAYENVLQTCGQLNKRLDPIAHIAISYSSAMLHAYITNSDSCVNDATSETLQATDLNLTDGPKLHICVANANLRFADCLSRGGRRWQIGANIISRYQV